MPLHGLDGPGREGLVHQPAQPGVVRRVLVEHRDDPLIDQHVKALGRQPLFDAAEPVGGQLRVAQPRRHRLVTGHHPGVEVRYPEHRVGGTQPVVDRIRIRHHLRAEKLQPAIRLARLGRHERSSC